jgi:hypothetical protein
LSLVYERAVVVVGAGASVPFGAPDGLKLMDRIEATLKSNQRKMESLAESKPFQINLRDLSPIYWAWHDGKDNQVASPHAAAAEYMDLANWLSKQTSDSIDDVIRHNPKYADRLRVCIVYELLQVTHAKDRNEAYVPRNLETRSIEVGGQPQRNWIHRLINVARAAMIEARQNGWPANPKVKIVSFNYDSILERVLDKKWDDVESEFGDWRDVFEIYHPHGRIPIPIEPIRRDQLVTYLRDGASGIAVVHDEAVCSEIEADRHSAKACCQSATNIYAMGFAFAPLNCELLGLNNPLYVDPDDMGEQHYPSKRKVHYINYDGSDGLNRRVEKMTEYDEEDNTRSQAPTELYPTMPSIGKTNVEITDAILARFLGEMPA